MESKTVKSRYENEKTRLISVNELKESGRAGKVSTAKNSGKYVIRCNDNEGTSLLTRAVFALARKGKETSISSQAFSDKLTEVTKTPKILSSIKFPANYANLKTVTNRLLSEIRNGFILSVSLPEGCDESVLKVFKA
jgi:hypothetical protein